MISRMVRLDWIRALHGVGIWIALLLTVAVMAMAFSQYSTVEVFGGYPPAYFNAYQALLSGLGYSPDTFFFLVIPILAVLPNGDSLALDRESGADGSFLVRAGWHGYLWGRFLGNATVAGATVFVGLLISGIVASFLFPVALPHYLGVAGHAAFTHQGVYGQEYQPFVWPALFWHAPWLYVLLVMGVATIATGVLAVIATVAALWIRRRVVVLVVAVAIFFAADMGGQLVGLRAWVPSEMVGNYLSNYTHAPAGILAYWIVPGLVMSAITWWRVRSHEWPH